jgi:hypothetical protein
MPHVPHGVVHMLDLCSIGYRLIGDNLIYVFLIDIFDVYVMCVEIILRESQVVLVDESGSRYMP